MKWNVICFDLDNTLYNYEKTFQLTMEYCYQILSRKYDYPYSSANEWFSVFHKYCDLYWTDYASKKLTKQQYRRQRFVAAMTELKLNATDEQADFLQSTFKENVARFAIPFDGMMALLNKLKAFQQVKLGIITNGNTSIQTNKIKSLNYNEVFPESSIFISGQLDAAKPDRQIFDIAQNNLGATGDNCLFIGDSWEHDVIGAIHAGWDAVYFNSRNQFPTSTDLEVPICRTVAELDEFFFKGPFP